MGLQHLDLDTATDVLSYTFGLPPSSGKARLCLDRVNDVPFWETTVTPPANTSALQLDDAADSFSWLLWT